MKYQKYLLILILIVSITFGYNKVYAEESKECFYKTTTDDGEISIALKLIYKYNNVDNLGGRISFTQVHINEYDDSNLRQVALENNKEPIINWWYNTLELNPKKGRGMTNEFSPIYPDPLTANDAIPQCPKYLVVEYTKTAVLFGSYHVWATDSKTFATQAVDEINQHTGLLSLVSSNSAIYAEYTGMTKEEYYGQFITSNYIKRDYIPKCTEIFGEKSNPDSIANLISTILSYVRIIVPILVIGLGSLDLARAVIAGKEDEMKKAQTKFVKRLIAGIIVFIIPWFINLTMEIADIAWESQYKICDISDL